MLAGCVMISQTTAEFLCYLVGALLKWSVRIEQSARRRCYLEL